MYISINDFEQLLGTEISSNIPCARRIQIHWEGLEELHYVIYTIADMILNAHDFGMSDFGNDDVWLWVVDKYNQVISGAFDQEAQIDLYNQLCRMLGKTHKIIE